MSQPRAYVQRPVNRIRNLLATVPGHRVELIRKQALYLATQYGVRADQVNRMFQTAEVR